MNSIPRERKMFFVDIYDTQKFSLNRFKYIVGNGIITSSIWKIVLAVLLVLA